MTRPCSGCCSRDSKRFVITLACAAGDDDGSVVADVDLYLCDDCEEVAGDLLLSLPLRLVTEVAAGER